MTARRYDHAFPRIGTELSTTMGINHWSEAISEINGNCRMYHRASRVRNSRDPATCGCSGLSCRSWLRLLRCEQSGLRLAVYKGDYNSTQMANCNAALLKSSPCPSPLCPIHCLLPIVPTLVSLFLPCSAAFSLVQYAKRYVSLGVFSAVESFPGQIAASAGISRCLSLSKSCLDHRHIYFVKLS